MGKYFLVGSSISGEWKKMELIYRNYKEKFASMII